MRHAYRHARARSLGRPGVDRLSEIVGQARKTAETRHNLGPRLGPNIRESYSPSWVGV